MLQHAGELLYLMGWAEVKDSQDVHLIFSIVDPVLNYDAATRWENRRYVCSRHLAPVISHHLAPVNPKYLE